MGIVTNHASDRTRERVGLPKRCSEKNAQRAWENGIKHSETSGRLRKYLDYLACNHGYHQDARIYSGYVYIFKGESLITVIPLPPEHRKAAEAIAKKKKVEREKHEEH